MNATSARPFFSTTLRSISKTRVRSNTLYGAIIILAMLAFEAFNYGTTSYALRDLLGDLRFANIPWATLMALAFCGLDFAGIARLITQKGQTQNPKESWYLFGAWLIAGTFNAALTWWGVSLAINTHTTQSSVIINAQALGSTVPVMVAIMVWIIRILIIGSLSSAMERLHPSNNPSTPSRRSSTPSNNFPVPSPRQAATLHRNAPSNRPSHSVAAQAKPEPTYHKFGEPAQASLRGFQPSQGDRPTRNL